MSTDEQLAADPAMLERHQPDVQLHANAGAIQPRARTRSLTSDERPRTSSSTPHGSASVSSRSSKLPQQTHNLVVPNAPIGGCYARMTLNDARSAALQAGGSQAAFTYERFLLREMLLEVLDLPCVKINES